MVDRGKNAELGRVDRCILRELQIDGSMSNAALGEKAATSESAATRHRHRLERDGYIRRYAAIVDRELLGYALTVFVEIGLKSQEEEASAAFGRAVGEIGEVMECYAVAGELDYLLRVNARDAKDFEHVRHRLSGLAGVGHLRSHVVLHDVVTRNVLLPPPRSQSTVAQASLRQL